MGKARPSPKAWLSGFMHAIHDCRSLPPLYMLSRSPPLHHALQSQGQHARGWLLCPEPSLPTHTPPGLFRSLLLRCTRGPKGARKLGKHTPSIPAHSLGHGEQAAILTEGAHVRSGGEGGREGRTWSNGRGGRRGPNNSPGTGHMAPVSPRSRDLYAPPPPQELAESRERWQGRQWTRARR